MYTTDSIPVVAEWTGRRPIREAWIVAARTVEGGFDDALSRLRKEAGKRGADAIIAVRLGVSAREAGSVTFAYGTAVKLGEAVIRTIHPTSVRVVP
ncbi:MULTISPECIES: heavy metal-binding domain-containing protein [unclassified Streptomyces]|uniref:heavy metal-binding domain-containing protein n=1 Tax=unclassified Streptomyces TaxID=2593676 RepID=UPI0011656689|nr:MULTISPECIES: heavy metal-binding domain-containing protein [unclassified Streptomyces]NMI57103.1 YbjQ family protein [Streptomyces sp. RLA2-12]QDN56483.1 YbjQ family protein [Streptomyces sp. S1D4-20]QDN66660.1 YbjQ family protein [Streptomyces sp. S1D4-14]QDO49067.1 YbjQ family protein [Streptomyces sp. RLB3-5]QDO59308.1 YbjQ family protein [Streptomyces sp. RLB1-8]